MQVQVDHGGLIRLVAMVDDIFTHGPDRLKAACRALQVSCGMRARWWLRQLAVRYSTVMQHSFGEVASMDSTVSADRKGDSVEEIAGEASTDNTAETKAGAGAAHRPMDTNTDLELTPKSSIDTSRGIETTTAAPAAPVKPWAKSVLVDLTDDIVERDEAIVTALVRNYKLSLQAVDVTFDQITPNVDTVYTAGMISCAPCVAKVGLLASTYHDCKKLRSLQMIEKKASGMSDWVSGIARLKLVVNEFVEPHNSKVSSAVGTQEDARIQVVMECLARAHSRLVEHFISKAHDVITPDMQVLRLIGASEEFKADIAFQAMAKSQAVKEFKKAWETAQQEMLCAVTLFNTLNTLQVDFSKDFLANFKEVPNSEKIVQCQHAFVGQAVLQACYHPKAEAKGGRNALIAVAKSMLKALVDKDTTFPRVDELLDSCMENAHAHVLRSGTMGNTAPNPNVGRDQKLQA